MKTKSRILPALLTLTACATFVAETATADNFTLPAIDPGGTSSLTNPLTGATATGWTGGNPSTTKNAPTAGNTYTVGGGGSLIAVRGPTTGATPTFPGDSLTLLGNGRLLLKTPKPP